MTALVQRLRARPPLMPGISAILVKDLRGRMRGRRAFLTLTIYLILLAGVGWMIERLIEQNVVQSCFGCGQSTFASATIGRGVFDGILMLQTLIVAVFAPASTASAISGEREHQTLDLLAVTPISSVAIVVGKLLSALAWIFVLVVASIPISGLVFLFGGVGLDDLLRGYLVVLATGLGLGSFGLFFSSWLKRTGVSIGLTFVVMILFALGTTFLWIYAYGTGTRDNNGVPKAPPEVILWLNPFVAQADVACGTEGGFGTFCSMIGTITGQDNGFNGGVRGGVAPAPVVAGFDSSGNPIFKGGGVAVGGAPAPDQPAFAVADSLRDRFWPKTVLSFLVGALVLTFASVQLVSPTRRWRPNVRGAIGRLARRVRRRAPAE
jgi:ABC-type transport system involved in multi-copper enzyme maturation permease subunit